MKVTYSTSPVQLNYIVRYWYFHWCQCLHDCRQMSGLVWRSSENWDADCSYWERWSSCSGVHRMANGFPTSWDCWLCSQQLSPTLVLKDFWSLRYRTAATVSEIHRKATIGSVYLIKWEWGSKGFLSASELSSCKDLCRLGMKMVACMVTSPVHLAALSDTIAHMLKFLSGFF